MFFDGQLRTKSVFIQSLKKKENFDMGTLLKQTERDYALLSKDTVTQFLSSYRLDQTDENTLKAIELLEYERRTNFMINNGDRWDEQMAGFGKILIEIKDAIRKK